MTAVGILSAVRYIYFIFPSHPRPPRFTRESVRQQLSRFTIVLQLLRHLLPGFSAEKVCICVCMYARVWWVELNWIVHGRHVRDFRVPQGTRVCAERNMEVDSFYDSVRSDKAVLDDSGTVSGNKIGISSQARRW